MIENAMVSGCFPYDAEFAPEPDYKCPRCSEPMDGTDRVYEWAEDWICDECFRDAIFSLSKDERADMSGECIVYTEQQLESVNHYAPDMADILGVDTMYVEDIV